MKPKEIQTMLGINADRIKLFKREGVFTPENPPSGNHATDYTQADFEALKRLTVLTKMGLTCSDIRRMQSGECTLEAAILDRRKSIEADIVKKQNALSLLSGLLEDKEEFESFHVDYYWNVITRREAEGEEFINPEDMYGYRPVSLIRTVQCLYCGEELEVDFEDYETDVSSYDNDNGMGEDIVHSFDSEDNIECPSCGKRYQVSGWIREYPVGAYDSEEVGVNELPEEG